MINPSNLLPTSSFGLRGVNRINVAFVRGAYLNNFEGQNYCFNKKSINIVGISSLHPLHVDLPFPIVRLPSIGDYLGSNKAVKIIANRTFGDAQILFGLSKTASQFDLFHTGDPHYYYSYQLAQLRKQNKIRKLLVTSWETIPHNNETVKEKKRIKQCVLNHADHFLCYTNKAKNCLTEEGVCEAKISVIRLGVDLKKFQNPIANEQSPTIKRQSPNNIRILFVGRLVEEKGILDLYEAYKNVKYQIPNNKFIKLLIIGEGPLKHKLQKMIVKDGFEKDITIEQKSYKDMPGVYQNADIFILPSKHTPTWEEQYGMSFVEAMASGLPIITYDTGAIREIVDSAGVYLHEGDIGGLAFVIKNMIADRKYMRRLGTMGRSRAEKVFDSRKTAKKIEQLYKKLLKQ